MAFGAVFIPSLQEPYYDFILVEYTPSGYLGSEKTKKDSNILHEAYRIKYNAEANILEISRFAKKPGDIFSTKYAKILYQYTYPYKHQKSVCIETVFHGSKCFEKGGPYKDIIMPSKTSHSARYDKRLQNSGKLLNYHLYDRTYPSYPATSAFYDWLYISALQGNSNICDLSSLLFEYDGFTDMDYNPNTQMCVVCPARVAAMYVGMTKAGVLTNPVDFSSLATLDNMMLQADIGRDGDHDVIMEIAPSKEKVEVILDNPPMEVEVGDKIVNKVFGVGEVVETSDKIITIDFGIKGKKKFNNPDAFNSGFLEKQKQLNTNSK